MLRLEFMTYICLNELLSLHVFKIWIIKLLVWSNIHVHVRIHSLHSWSAGSLHTHHWSELILLLWLQFMAEIDRTFKILQLLCHKVAIYYLALWLQQMSKTVIWIYHCSIRICIWHARSHHAWNIHHLHEYTSFI